MNGNLDKPDLESQFLLLPCGACRGEDVVYVQFNTGGQRLYLAKCRGCGQRTPWYGCKHDAQVDWNERFGRR